LSRFSIAFCTELALQVQYQFKAIVWLGATVIFLVRGIFQVRGMLIFIQEIDFNPLAGFR